MFCWEMRKDEKKRKEKKRKGQRKNRNLRHGLEVKWVRVSDALGWDGSIYAMRCDAMRYDAMRGDLIGVVHVCLS